MIQMGSSLSFHRKLWLNLIDNIMSGMSSSSNKLYNRFRFHILDMKDIMLTSNLANKYFPFNIILKIIKNQAWQTRGQ